MEMMKYLHGTCNIPCWQFLSRFISSFSLRSKRSRLESDIKDLTSCADDFAVRAEQDRDFGLVTKSNAMRKSTQEKATQLSAVQSDLDGMLKVLKGL